MEGNSKKRLAIAGGVLILIVLFIVVMGLKGGKQSDWTRYPEGSEKRFNAQQAEPSKIMMVDRKTGEKLNPQQNSANEEEKLSEGEEVRYITLKKLAREVLLSDIKTGEKIEGKLYIALDAKVAVNKQSGKVIRILGKGLPYVISDTPGLYWRTQGFAVDTIDAMNARYSTTGQAVYQKGTSWTVQPAQDYSRGGALLGDVETLAAVLSFDS